jgi:linearmycin/streptolysin S transport system permease protein
MISVGKVLEIARVNLVRQVRDRGDLFFVFVLPTIIIVALGLQFAGGDRSHLGVVGPADDPAAAALIATLRADSDQLDVDVTTDVPTLRDEVERGQLDAGLVIPEGLNDALRGDGSATIQLLTASATPATSLRTPVDAAVARVNAVATAARVAAAVNAGTFDAARAAASDAISTVPGIAVDVTWTGGPAPFAGFSQFSYGASTQLVLFMFLTSMTAASRLVTTRDLGVSRRMLAGPTSVATVIAGEAAGRYAIALLQATYIVAVSAFVFNVDWGDPLAAGAIIATFALVASAIAVLVGAIASSSDQAGALGVFIGLTLGALGGCMVPFQLMPDAMQAVARLLPHSWAVLGLQDLMGGTSAGGPASVAPNVAILAAYGVVVMAFATWRFRRAISA